MSRALFIGRFQPLHKGHLDVIKKALKEYDELIIGVGSSNKSCEERNPFTFEERARMIKSAVKGNYRIVPIEDVNDDDEWMNLVDKAVGGFNVLFTNNPLMTDLFRNYGFNVMEPGLSSDLCATRIRSMIHKDSSWQSCVPEEVARVIKDIDGVARIKEVMK